MVLVENRKKWFECESCKNLLQNPHQPLPHPHPHHKGGSELHEMDDSNLVKDTEGRGQGQGQETQDNEVTTSRRLENRLPQESGAFRNRQYTDAPSRIPPDQDSGTRSRTDPDWDNDDDDDGGHAGTNSPFDDHPKVVPRNNKSAEAGKSVSTAV